MVGHQVLVLVIRVRFPAPHPNSKQGGTVMNALLAIALAVLMVFVLFRLIDMAHWLFYRKFRRKCPHCGSKKFLILEDICGMPSSLCLRCHGGFYVVDQSLFVHPMSDENRDTSIGLYTRWDVDPMSFDNVPWAYRVYLRSQDDPFWKGDKRQ